MHSRAYFFSFPFYFAVSVRKPHELLLGFSECSLVPTVTFTDATNATAQLRLISLDAGRSPSLLPPKLPTKCSPATAELEPLHHNTHSASWSCDAIEGVSATGGKIWNLQQQMPELNVFTFSFLLSSVHEQ